MEVTIQSTEEKPLLKRKEIVARVFFTGPTPSRQEVASAISDKAKVKKNLLVIEHINTSFGDTVAHVECSAYSDEDAMKFLERENLLEKHIKPPKEKPEPASKPEQSPSQTKAAEDSESEKSKGESEASEGDKTSKQEAPEAADDEDKKSSE